jgi:hypothetical protein
MAPGVHNREGGTDAAAQATRGRAHDATEACEPSRLSMVVVESTELGVEQV